MSICQPSPRDGSSYAEARLQAVSPASFGRLVYLALVRWRERRRVKADLARLAEAGDYLLLDIGLDPETARRNPEAALDQITRDR